MNINYVGVLLNTVMVIVIIVLIISAVGYRGELTQCQTEQNSSCYTLRCPADTQDSLPCRGWAKMPGPNSGEWYCSNSVRALVDNNGNQI